MEIRPFAPADFAVILGWFRDETALIQWGGPEVRFPLDAPQLECMRSEGQQQPPARMLWSGAEEGIVVGHAQVALNSRHGVGLLHRVCIAPSFRGTGLAVPFLRQVIRKFFEMPEFERLEANLYTFNPAAIKTCLRLGFVEEGIRRASVRVGDARWDTAIFSLLRNESNRLRGDIGCRGWSC